MLGAKLCSGHVADTCAYVTFLKATYALDICGQQDLMCCVQSSACAERPFTDDHGTYMCRHISAWALQQHNGTAHVAVSAAPIVARLAEVELWAALTSVPILPRRRLMVAREEPLAAIVNWRFARRALVDDCLVAEAGGAVPAAVPRGVGGVDVLCLARVAAAGGNAFAPVDTRPLRNTSLAARVACAGSAGLNKFSCPTVAPVQTELARLSC